jgi:hypothetical protein
MVILTSEYADRLGTTGRIAQSRWSILPAAARGGPLVFAMFEEGQLYSPVTTAEDGSVEVHLGEDHPGFHDEHYRAAQ